MVPEPVVKSKRIALGKYITYLKIIKHCQDTMFAANKQAIKVSRIPNETEDRIRTNDVIFRDTSNWLPYD